MYIIIYLLITDKLGFEREQSTIVVKIYKFMLKFSVYVGTDSLD